MPCQGKAKISGHTIDHLNRLLNLFSLSIPVIEKKTQLKNQGQKIFADAHNAASVTAKCVTATCEGSD